MAEADEKKIVKMDRVETEGLLDRNVNAKQLVCLRCGSKILPPKVGVYFEDIDFDLYVMHKKQEEQGLVKETTNQFYVVDNMFDFDNVGFTKNIDDKVKLLTCADCEVGPIGWHDLKTKRSYVALGRIKHQT